VDVFEAFVVHVRMAVNGARLSGPARDIDDSGLVSGGPGIFGIAADGDETTRRDGRRLFDPEGLIYGQNFATNKNQIGGHLANSGQSTAQGAVSAD